MYLGEFKGKRVFDKCIAVYFKEPNTYTGEDIVEFHVHGGARLAGEILNELLESGARLADKGEFTRRAFFNDKISLDGAEGILEMIQGESLAAVNAGFRLQKGDLSKKALEISSLILDAVSALEVGLDNPDEFGDSSLEEAKPYVDKATEQINEVLKGAYVSDYVENGILVAIMGQTNRGKSSLLNALTHTDRAIVTSVAGTTRDVIEQSIEYKGYKLTFADTAGLRETDDEIERIGIKRANDIAVGADVILVLSDAVNGLDEYDKEIIEKFSGRKMICVFNKCDLLDEDTLNKKNKEDNAIYISALNGYNVNELLDKIIDLLDIEKVDAGQGLYLNKRHVQALKQALYILQDVQSKWLNTTQDCLIVDLNDAISRLSSIDGSRVSTAVVDNVFSKFCVGK